MLAKAKRRAKSVRERWLQRLKGLPSIWYEEEEHTEEEDDGKVTGVGGLAVIALIGLVAFGCGVAVLTYAALTLVDLRHTNRNYASALCNVTGHSVSTRLRCANAACRPMVKPLLVVLYQPDLVLVPQEALAAFVPPPDGAASEPSAAPTFNSTNPAPAAANGIVGEERANASSGAAGPTPNPISKPTTSSGSSPRDEIRGASVLPTTIVTINTTARWRAGHQWVEERTAREFLEHNPVNSTRECFYDPQKPYNVVMYKEYATTLSFWSWLCGSLLVSFLCILLAAYLLHLVVLWAPADFITRWRRPRIASGNGGAGAINASSSNYYGTFTGQKPWSADYVPVGDVDSDSDGEVEIELQTRRQQRRALV